MLPPIFRFTIRDVLWLTVVVGVALGWVLERQRSKRLQYEVDVAENEADQSRMTIEIMYDDLNRIEQALAPHGLKLAWSKDLRPSIQTMSPTSAGPATVSKPEPSSEPPESQFDALIPLIQTTIVPSSGGK
jgi:hypothetical protein